MDTPGIIRGQRLFHWLALVCMFLAAAWLTLLLLSLTALPAKIAGVKEIVMVTPPQRDGINPAVLGRQSLLALMQYTKLVVLKV